MPTVKVKRAFYGNEKSVKAGDEIEVSDLRAKELAAKGLVEIIGSGEKEAKKPENKQAPASENKQAPEATTKAKS